MQSFISSLLLASISPLPSSSPLLSVGSGALGSSVVDEGITLTVVVLRVVDRGRDGTTADG